VKEIEFLGAICGEISRWRACITALELVLWIDDREDLNGILSPVREFFLR